MSLLSQVDLIQGSRLSGFRVDTRSQKSDQKRTKRGQKVVFWTKKGSKTGEFGTKMWSKVAKSGQKVGQMAKRVGHICPMRNFKCPTFYPFLGRDKKTGENRQVPDVQNESYVSSVP